MNDALRGCVLAGLLGAVYGAVASDVLGISNAIIAVSAVVLGAWFGWRWRRSRPMPVGARGDGDDDVPLPDDVDDED